VGHAGAPYPRESSTSGSGALGGDELETWRALHIVLACSPGTSSRYAGWSSTYLTSPNSTLCAGHCSRSAHRCSVTAA